MGKVFVIVALLWIGLGVVGAFIEDGPPRMIPKSVLLGPMTFAAALKQ